MHKVISVNLNGRAYQLEEAGYHELQKYLQTAQTKLANDPDKEEVMRDFEQAIADKCDEHLHAHKDVMTTEEISAIVKAMGPVETAETDEAGNDGTSTKQAEDTSKQRPKRLYTLKEGSMIGGVCSGLAAYLKVDVTWVRLAFVILAFITSGTWIVVYLIMMFVIPEAKTPEQKAELRGEHFTAQTIIDNAKQKYAEMSQDEKWKHMANNAGPAVEQAATALGRFFCMLFAIASGIVFGIVTAAYVIAMRWVIFENIHLIDQLQTISLWAIVALLTATYMLIAIPFLQMSVGSQRFASQRVATKKTNVWAITAWAGWSIALVVWIFTLASIDNRVGDYLDTHNAIYFDNTTLCIKDGCVSQ